MAIHNLTAVPYAFDRDEEVIVLLHKVFLPWQGGIEYFNWKYNGLRVDGCLFPRAWVIKHRDKIIAFNGYIPREVIADGKKYWVVQSFDTATDPAYRGNGLFGILQNSVYAEMKRYNIAWVYGWTSEIGHKVFTEKMKWREWGRQRYLMKVLDTREFMNTKISNPFLSLFASFGMHCICQITKPSESKQIHVKKSEHFSYEFDRYIKSINKKYSMIAVRDSQYLNWRISSPLSNYEIFEAKDYQSELCGYAIIIEREECLDIEDCVAESKAVLLNLLAAVEKVAIRKDKKLIRYRINEKNSMANTFHRAGYFWSKTFFSLLGMEVGETDFVIPTNSIHWTLIDRNE